YGIVARFGDAQGIRTGMSVKFIGSDIGQVERFSFEVDEQTGVPYTAAQLRISNRITLYSDDQLIIRQEGLLGEKYITVIRLPGTEEEVVQPGGTMYGYTEPGMLEGIQEFQASANTIMESVNSLLREESLAQKFEELRKSFEDGVERINTVLDDAGLAAIDGEGFLTRSMRNVHQTSENFLVLSRNLLVLSRNLEEASQRLSALMDEPRYESRLKGFAETIEDTSERVNHIALQIDSLVSDPEFVENIKESARLTRETLEEAKSTLQHFQETTDSLVESADSLLDDAGDVVTDVRSKVEQFSSAGDAVEVRLGMDVRAKDMDGDRSLSGNDDYVGDFSAALSIGNRFIEVGADNIGEESDLNLIFGFGSLSGFRFGGGVVRSELGLSAAYNFPGGGGAQLRAYDTDDPTIDAFGRIPVGESVSVIVGVEDATDAALASVGVGLEF
ncbi:MCE family protein, partial [bacterium]|nr:MCE family protein [bacterium]